ncbi:MAG: glutamine--fructose-6-phosphate transaminase (isomerizing) [Myxococcota bacterium]|nr:glutamine--fructose-6-phosphate transaminase (isomerizing) [Myxococcota bacterium]
MCGIIGYTGPRQARGLLLEGLRRLEYRGYDSAGLAVHDDRQLQVHRAVGRVAGLSAAVPGDLAGSTGIAHTRWATHGGVTLENAHPHMDTLQRIAVVHNGIIENMGPLKAKLESEGVRFRSETDSEILAHLIARFYEGQGALDDSISPDAAGDPLEAVRAALARVRGTWGVAVVFADHPEVIICARNGSPLVVGLGDGETFIASDPHALTPHTRRVVFLEDGEIARLDPQGVQTQRLDGGTNQTVIEELAEEWGDAEKGDFPHFMLKEIHEQPEALRQCLGGRVLVEDGTAKLGGLELSPREQVDIRHINLLGCGTAYHACLVGAQVIEQLARVPARACIASEFRYSNPVIDPADLFFAVSQSGETADTLGAVKEIQLKGGKAMGVVNVVGSSIARTCGRGVYVHSGPEMAVASTKAFSNMVAALGLFALQVGRTRALSAHQGRQVAEALQQIPLLVERYLADPGPIDEMVRCVQDAKMVLFLGRGVNAAVAAEGALKLMEVAYIPCIAYPSGEMKHGPIALLEDGSPVIVIAPDDPLKDKSLSNLQECRARGARIILIHTEGDDETAALGDVSIAVPRTSDLLSPLLTVLPLQLLAYKAGLALGRDIDRPRNLAKSVTVE